MNLHYYMNDLKIIIIFKIQLNNNLNGCFPEPNTDP